MNLSNSKVGSSSCQGTTTLYGENDETQKNVLRILLQLRIMLPDSCWDVGHFGDLHQRRNGTELTLINQTENGTKLQNKGKPLKLRHYDISRAHFQGTARRLMYIKLPAEDRQKHGEDKVGRLVKSMYGTQGASHICQLDCVNLICADLGGCRRGTHSAALFHNPNQYVIMAVHGDDFVCLSDDDGLKHIDSLVKSKYTAKDMGTHGFEDSDMKSLLLLNRVFRVGVDQT